MQSLCIALIAYGEFNKLTTSGTTSHRQVVSWESLENFDDISVVYKTGLLIFHGKKAKSVSYTHLTLPTIYSV